MSRYIVGAVGIIVALMFISYSSVIAWSVATKMNTEFAQLAGGAAVAMVVWGSIGLLFANSLWHAAPRWLCPQTILAAACLVLVLAAEIYITRLDLRFQVTGQADITAQRVNKNEKSADAKTELVKARARRDVLQARKLLSGFEREELEKITARIALLETEWKTSIVNAGGMPEASWMARWSHDENWWEGALMIFGLIFWPLVRMFALPIAIVSMQEAVRKPHKTDAKPDSDRDMRPDLPAVTVRPRTAMPTLEKISGQMPRYEYQPMTIGTGAVKFPPLPAILEKGGNTEPPTDGGTPIDVRPDEHPEKFAETNTVVTGPWQTEEKPVASREIRRHDSALHLAARWAKDFAPSGSPTKRAKGKHVQRHHLEWCETAGLNGRPIKPLTPTRLGMALSKLKETKQIDLEVIRKAHGVVYVFNGNSVEVKSRRAA